MAAGMVGIGLIGCGGIMGSHISNCGEIEQVQITALADVEESQMAGAVAEHPVLDGLPQFSDYREMIEKVSLDGVVIATPHSLHFDQTMTCLNADRNFVDSILGRDEPQTPAICGLRVMELTEAAWESARIGGPVTVK